jgi:hypothetical protein
VSAATCARPVHRRPPIPRHRAIRPTFPGQGVAAALDGRPQSSGAERLPMCRRGGRAVSGFGPWAVPPPRRASGIGSASWTACWRFCLDGCKGSEEEKAGPIVINTGAESDENLTAEKEAKRVSQRGDNQWLPWHCLVFFMNLNALSCFEQYEEFDA